MIVKEFIRPIGSVEMLIDGEWLPYSSKESYLFMIENNRFPEGRVYDGKDFFPYSLETYFFNQCHLIGLNVLKQQWEDEEGI